MSQQERAEGRTKYGSVPYAAPRQPQLRQIRHGIDKRPIRVGFVGNPNCGKTTLFNAFTGAKLKVANWPGVTVERVEGETNYKMCIRDRYRAAVTWQSSHSVILS